MKKYRKINLTILLSAIALIEILPGCTKIGNGFLSPYVTYAVTDFSIIRGRTATSYSIVTDGSSIPMNIKWTNIYDSTGKIVDDIFSKEYPIAVWTAAYDPTTDNTFASIIAKQKIENLPPLVVNENNGTIEANAGTLNIPLGTYTMDLQVSNSAGTESLKKIMQIDIVDGLQVETAPGSGDFANGRAVAGTAPVTYFFNGQNNPFSYYTVTRFADTPNVFILKFTDRNGVPFDPKTGEIIKRPAAGLNPVPPYLPNLQDYAPDTYVALDTAMYLKYPLVPFPIVSIADGFNMYYNINTAFVQIDSTSAWSSNSAGIFYQGTSDSHYLGTYVNGEYDYSIRVPMRIEVPGSYELTVKILNVTHR
ncbi:MAG TPA: hypothetical protein VIJ95_15860 [Hanamia sp.]